MKKPRTDLALAALALLAALAVPRVVVHDLHLVPLDSPLYTLLAVGPFIVWLGVAVFHKSKQPFQNFLVLGLLFGVMLALTHQLTWDASWAGNPPHLHGNLEGKLNPATESLLLRSAAFISSLVTGLVFGSVFGLAAVIAGRVRR